MTVSERRSMRIPAELGRVADVRKLVRDVAGACNAPEPCMDDLVQAVDEATTNVILHGYRGGPGWVDVAAERVGDQIIVTVTDEAPPFDPTGVPEPDLSISPNRRRPGGMGVHLIRKATDSLDHAPRPGGGNILTLARRLDLLPKEERS
jgi:serine/threonine-protein kinase RsbW